MNLSVKKLHPDATLPKYAKQGDSGFDLIAIEDAIIEPGETKLIKTGLAFEIPDGYEIQVRPRSGITLKTKMRVQLGTIDSNYRGEVGVIVDNIETGFHVIKTKGSNHFIVPVYEENVIGINGQEVVSSENYFSGTYIVKKGDRIAQAILAPVTRTEFIEADNLSETERGVNGYGSTGIN